jgi:hypothetical protein
LKLLLGTNPKEANEGRLGKEEVEGVGQLIQSFGEQEKSGSRAEIRQRRAVVEGDFWAGLGHSREAIYRPYCAAETAHIRAIYNSNSEAAFWAFELREEGRTRGFWSSSLRVHTAALYSHQKRP